MSEGQAAKFQSRLVEELKKSGYLHAPQVEQAFRSVPRHIFLPGEPLERAYSDRAIAVKRDAEGNWCSSSSQPAIMALMLEQLDLHPGQRVLEIGTGTGFNAALMAAIVGSEGRVVTVDIQPDLVEEARKHLREAGFEWVSVIAGDGGTGYLPGAPYDRVIVTAASSMIPPAWREQLAEGGVLVLPLDIGGGLQKSVAFQRRGSFLESTSNIDAGFMPIQGTYAAVRAQTVQLGPDPRLYLSSFHGFPVDGETLNVWFRQSQASQPAGLPASIKEILVSFVTWLTVHGAGWAQLNAVGELAGEDVFPAILIIGGEKASRITLAMIGSDGMAVLGRPPGQAIPWKEINDLQPEFSTAFDLTFHQYGPGAESASQLKDFLHQWDQAGRPPSDQLHFRAIPAGQEVELREGEHLLKRPWTDLVAWYA